MEQFEIEVLRGMLISIATGSDRTGNPRDEIAIESSADTLDQMSDAARRELAAHRLDIHAKRLMEATAALRRMEEGTYGTCLACASQISVARLKAVPWTRYCIACQQLADQGENGNGMSSRPSGDVRFKSAHVGVE
jgi:DnaK suppressor protein